MAGVKGRSGGARVNSGPPRKPGSVRWQREQRRLKRAPVAALGQPAVSREAVPVPDDLPADQRAIWLRLAPHAIEAGTLTVATGAAFADLCEAIALKREMFAQIKADGLTSQRVTLQMSEDGAGLQNVEPRAHPLLAKFQAQMVRVEAGMARFLLTGTGKPVAVAAPPKDDFQEFDQPLTLVKGGR